MPKSRHWTEESLSDFQFHVADDFISRLEAKLESDGISHAQFAAKLSISEGRVSQVFNDPGNLTLRSMIKWARTAGLKLSVLAYDDDDSQNIKGPIHSAVFLRCWETAGKPSDFWDFEQETDGKQVNHWADTAKVHYVISKRSIGGWEQSSRVRYQGTTTTDTSETPAFRHTAKHLAA